MGSCAKIFGLEITRYTVGCKGMDKQICVSIIIIMQIVIKTCIYAEESGYIIIIIKSKYIILKLSYTDLSKKNRYKVK